MALFEKEIHVLSKDSVSVGDFDPTVDGCYRNVVTFPFDVRKNRVLYVKAVSDNPVDIAIANSDGSSAKHAEKITDSVIGPIPTGGNTEMGILIGLFPGDKAKVSFDIWMERR